MNIEKIKKYNQLLLAIIGTGFGLFLLGCLIVLLIEYIDHSYYKYYEPEEIGVISDDAVEVLKTDSLRKQIISFGEIETIDSANQLFLIPVTQSDLEKEEYFEEDISGLMNVSSGGSYYRKNFSYDKIWNNLIIYSGLTKSSEIIFKNRVAITTYSSFYKNQKMFLIIEAVTADTNKDGLLNDDDFKVLYLYDFEKSNLNLIKSKDNYTVLDTKKLAYSDILIVTFGYDKNKDGKFDYGKEPKIIFEIDVINNSLSSLIQEEQLIEIQNILQGTK